MMFGEHAAFIIPSFAISFFALSVTTIVIVRTYSMRKRELAHLEEQTQKNVK